jgi:hypothetical protein
VEEEARQEIADAVAEAVDASKLRRRCTDGSRTYQWTIGILVSVLFLAAGNIIGRESVQGEMKDNRTSHSEYTSKLNLHEEQLKTVNKTLDDIRQGQKDLGAKLDRVIERLPARGRP